MVDSADVILAGVIRLGVVMEALARARRLFHSEADFQFAFARTLFELAPSLRCRLEVPLPREGQRAEHVDLLCLGPDGASTAVEFKYFTRRWSGSVDGESYELRNHAASDLARLYYIHDVVRLERFSRNQGHDGLAIMLTNEPTLWLPPALRRRRPNFDAFRIHEGLKLEGLLEWRNYPGNRRELYGSYTVRWNDYAAPSPQSPGGTLRWTAIHVPAETTRSSGQ